MTNHTAKFVFITGGVCSGLGKGLTAASLGNLLKAAGYKVGLVKMDPYLNVDPGTMNPLQHGEVFVTDDGAETDLDLGHYERFLDISVTRQHNLTSGQVYRELLSQERAGDFLGKTLQVVPHVTEVIKKFWRDSAQRQEAEILFIEIGGTVGDIEGDPFLEAARQLKQELPPTSVALCHVTLLPYISSSKELKTKPTQASVRDLFQRGLQPDLIFARSDYPVDDEAKNKIALFASLAPARVIPALTVQSIYEIPLRYEASGALSELCQVLNLPTSRPNLKPWQDFVANILTPKNSPLTIAMIGKYTSHGDAYYSVRESLAIASAHLSRPLNLFHIDSENLEDKNHADWQKVYEASGLLVPGGFGRRGTEGKIAVATYALEKNKPYLGLCLGMQILTIALARQALKTKEVNSTEMDENVLHPVIHIMPRQAEFLKEKNMGNSMRLGAYPARLVAGSLARQAYGQKEISERHRHRYEFNNTYREVLEQAGLVLSGLSPDGELVEIVEIKNHPFALGTQFHPEFTSRPLRPHPLFLEFLKIAGSF